MGRQLHLMLLCSSVQYGNCGLPATLSGKSTMGPPASSAGKSDAGMPQIAAGGGGRAGSSSDTPQTD
jgi:hypothetical protein